MFKKLTVKVIGLFALLAALAGCAPQPMAVSHELVTPNKAHWAVQISMSTGLLGTPVQTVMVVYNKFSKQPLAVVQGNTLRLEDRLLDAILALGPSAITGNYILQAAKVECPKGTLCGTLVQVSNQAGANAGANAAAGAAPEN